MEVGKRYLDRVYRSIKSKMAKLEGKPKAVQALVASINEFYVSLFSTPEGIFGIREIDENLKDPPELPSSSTPSGEMSETSSPSKPVSSPTRGLGKGSPGRIRKLQVSQRQQRNRASQEFQKRKRKAAKDSQEHEIAKPTQEKASTSEADTHAQPTRSGESTPSKTDSIPTSREHTPPMIDPSESEEEEEQAPGKRLRTDEPRQPLTSQYRTTDKTVTIIQNLANTENKDGPHPPTEMELFFDMMNAWDLLDPRLVAALSDLNESDEPTIVKILKYSSTAMGITNCMHHMIGTLIKEAMKQDRSDTSSDLSVVENIANTVEQAEYQTYLKSLQNCACEVCREVIAFDRSYNRYHDSVETGQTLPSTEPPKIDDRPMHCSTVEIQTQSARHVFQGLSVTTLTKYYYFACSTPPFSPPTICLASPTHVLDAVVKYMQRYQQQRKLTDPLPFSWYVEENKELSILEIKKQNFHLYDGDSCELFVGEDDRDELKALKTNGDFIRIRLPYTDAPEVKHSIRIYKQASLSTSMTPFLTRHIGIESLRRARRIVHDADRIALAIPQVKVSHDVYDRLLANIFVEKDGRVESLARLLADDGYTLSFYTTGINKEINNRMRSAIANRTGMFNLPEESFFHPFRPWELRKEWNPLSPRYRTYVPISNRPDCPETEWAQPITPAVIHVDDQQPESSQQEDCFFLRIVECTLHHESLCFHAKSNISNAGEGLFLKPHGEIQKGSHLCLYSDQSISKEERNSNETSGLYILETSNLCFDAEEDNGNNRGRYCNQPIVLESFRKIKEQSTQPKVEFDEHDWRKVEAEIDDACNAEYKVVKGQLVVVAKINLFKTTQPEEVYTNYGGLRNYWILAELEKPGRFGEISEIIQWLLNSPQCNWSHANRENWTHR